MFTGTQRRKLKPEDNSSNEMAAMGGNGSADMLNVVSRSADDQPQQPPSYLLCPITGELMHQPSVISCGHLFDRNAILQLLQNEVRLLIVPCELGVHI